MSDGSAVVEVVAVFTGDLRAGHQVERTILVFAVVDSVSVLGEISFKAFVELQPALITAALLTLASDHKSVGGRQELHVIKLLWDAGNIAVVISMTVDTQFVSSQRLQLWATVVMLWMATNALTMVIVFWIGCDEPAHTIPVSVFVIFQISLDATVSAIVRVGRRGIAAHTFFVNSRQPVA